MTEYLVEVFPGRELVYRTPLALRAAMRSGEITADARIYHYAASRWIPITEHPEYRKFLAERRPPNWLEPIPYEPVPAEARNQEPDRPGRLAILLRGAWRWVQERRRRRAPQSPGEPIGGADPQKPAPPPSPRTQVTPTRRRGGTGRHKAPRPAPPTRHPHPASEEADPSPPRRWTFY